MKNTRIDRTTQVSGAELALVLGISGRRVQQLASDGVLRAVDRGKYSLVEGVQTYLETKVKAVPEGSELEKAELEIKQSKATIARLEAAELQGQMHRADDVCALTEDLLLEIRSMLMALPGRLAVDVSRVGSPAEAAEVLKLEVHAMMNDLAGYRYDPLKYEARVRERRKWEVYYEESGDG